MTDACVLLSPQPSKEDAYSFILVVSSAQRHRLSLVVCLCGDDSFPLHLTATPELAGTVLTLSSLCSNAEHRGTKGNGDAAATNPREPELNSFLPLLRPCSSLEKSEFGFSPHRHPRARLGLHFCALLGHSGREVSCTWQFCGIFDLGDSKGSINSYSSEGRKGLSAKRCLELMGD